MSKMKWVNNQAFAPYQEWECWKSGMYHVKMRQPTIAKAGKLLANAEKFFKTCQRLLDAWPISVAIHLSDKARNRRAFMGAAACCLVYQATELETRAAWWTLVGEQQSLANDIANGVIEEWEWIHLDDSCQKRNGQLVFPFLRPPDRE